MSIKPLFGNFQPAAQPAPVAGTLPQQQFSPERVKAALAALTAPPPVDRVELVKFGGAQPGKVAIIGAGNVGSSLALDLARQKLCKDIAMVDINGNVAKGKALDIQQACAVYGSDTKLVGSDDYSVIDNADIVVVTAGFPRRPGQSRDDLLAGGTKIVADVAKKIKQKAPNAFVIVVSNPLDAMCHVTQQVTGFPPERVIGMAGVLDSARFKTFLADELNVSVEDIQATVLGGHGDTMVPVPSQTTVSGIPVTQLIKPERLDEIIDRARNGGAEIVNLLNTSGYIAPGASIAKMVESVLRDKKSIIPCSVYLTGQYGINGLYAGVPVKLGKNGVEEIVQLQLTDKEKQLLAASAKSLKANADKIPTLLQALDNPAPPAADA